MKTETNKILSVILVCAALATIASCGGCKTTLDPEGPYAGDTTLHNAESMVTLSYGVFDTFVKWEFENRATLESADPKAAADIKEAADFVRKNAKTLIATTIAAIESYKTLKTPESQASLSTALKTLQAEVVKAASYIKTP